MVEEIAESQAIETISDLPANEAAAIVDAPRSDEQGCGANRSAGDVVDEIGNHQWLTSSVRAPCCSRC